MTRTRYRQTRRTALTLATAVAFILATAPRADAGTGDARGGKYRVISGSAASVAGVATSAGYQAYVVGGSGAAVGIAVSDATSVVGGNSTVEPPERIFRGNFDPP